jgi:PAS domain S-box
VVADEVRKLAEQTTKATKQIAGMIQQIQSDSHGAVQSMANATKQVDEGIVLADQAGASLKEIVEISQKVTRMVSEIAAANEEQSSTGELISKNMKAIATVTQETASGTQQIARAADDLNRLTEILQRLVSHFESTVNESVKKEIISQKLMRKDSTVKRSFSEDVLYSVDAKTREFTYLSRGFERLLGYTIEDVREMGGRQAFLSKVIENNQFNAQEDTFNSFQTQKKRAAPVWVAWWQCKDGHSVCLEDHSNPVYENGILVGTQGVLRDITERKLAEEERLRKRSKYSLLEKF